MKTNPTFDYFIGWIKTAQICCDREDYKSASDAIAKAAKLAYSKGCDNVRLELQLIGSLLLENDTTKGVMNVATLAKCLDELSSLLDQEEE